MSPRRCDTTETSALGTFCASPAIVQDVCSTLRGVKLGRKGVLRPSYNINGFVKLVPRDVNGTGVCNIRLSPISNEVTGRLCRGGGVTMRKFRRADCPSDFFSYIVNGIPFKTCRIDSHECSQRRFVVRSCFVTGSLSLIHPNNMITIMASDKAVSGRGPTIERCVTGQTRLLKTVQLPGGTFREGTGADIISSVLFFRGESETSVRRPR